MHRSFIDGGSFFIVQSRSFPVGCFSLLSTRDPQIVNRPAGRFLFSAPAAPTQSALSLTEEFTVSGLNFHGRSETLVIYQFSPNISGEDLSYQITFTDSWGSSYTFDAPCSGGVCYGEATLQSGYMGYDVTVSVTDGVISRNRSVARGLNFTQGRSSYTPT